MKLCKGYTVPAVGADKLLETLYAECPDGRVLSTGLIDASPCFDKSHREWFEVSNVPEGAQYIGTYPIPNAMPERV